MVLCGADRPSTGVSMDAPMCRTDVRRPAPSSTQSNPASSLVLWPPFGAFFELVLYIPILSLYLMLYICLEARNSQDGLEQMGISTCYFCTVGRCT